MKYRHVLKERKYGFLGMNQNSRADKEKRIMGFWNIEELSNSRLLGLLRIVCRPLISIKAFI